MIRDTRGDLSYWDKWINFNLSSIEDRKDIIEGIRTKRPGYSSDDSGCILNIVRTYNILPLNCYSRGDSIEGLKQYFEPKLDYSEQFEAAVAKQQDDTDWYRTKWSVNLNTYITCFWWVGLALALKIPNDQWQRLLKLISNEGEDELLDRIIATRQKDRKIGTKLCHSKPYQLLLDTINAPKEQQAQKLFYFVDNWYKQLGDKKRPYIPKGMPKIPHWHENSSTNGSVFAYWCIEAVAAVKAFNLDDSLCLGHENYPGDLLRPSGPTTHKAGAIPKENKDEQEAEKNKDAFLAAATNGDIEAIEALIKQGVDINAPDKYGATALMLACSNQHRELADKLVDYGADVNIDTDAGETVLMYAIDYGDKNLIKKLLNKGANPNEQDECGNTPLIRAASGNNANYCDMIQMLVEYGAKINQTNNDNSTPLIEAATSDCPENVKLLIKLGANLNKKTKEDGNTALIFAAGLGNVEIVKELVNAGADLNIKNKHGDTALQIVTKIIKDGYYEHDALDDMNVAYNNGYDEIEKILQKQ